jgi:hypothetical protein
MEPSARVNAMNQSLAQTTDLLTKTPATLNALLRDLPEPLTHTNEGQGTWSAHEVIAHLIDSERVNWLPRARHLLQFGETQPFTPFDRNGHTRESHAKSLPQLLDDFALIRTQNLAELHTLNLTPEDLTRTGLHPAFGPVTLAQLLATWVTHDLTHVHQLSRILAYQYRDAVGPWKQYLGVLQCAGHSS